MPSAEDDFALELVEMRRNYRRLILGLLDLLRPARARAVSGALSGEDRDLILHKSHQFAGTGASYGFPGLTDAGRALENLLVDHPQAAPGGMLILFDAFLKAAESAAVEREAPAG